MEQKTDIIASKFLGKKVEGCSYYNPSFLVAIPRIENRKLYNIEERELPFVGHDVWHAYEFSSMTNNGLPVTKLLKLKYNCNSEFIVESKSLKLYLNSFNMSRFGDNIENCLKECKKLIEKDLSDALKTKVCACFLDNASERVQIFQNFKNILEYVDNDKLIVDKFKEAPKILEFENLSEEHSYYLTFDSLRSNCRVTHQPDFGDVFIYYKSDKHIFEDSLIKYLCSFRSEYHFHEECCEMIYKRLYDLLDVDNNDELFVCALYTRRGGIDICPIRKSKNCGIFDSDMLVDLSKFARFGVKQ